MTYDGNCRLGDLFTSRREKGREGLPTLSVTLNNGVVNRNDLDRKQETTLSAEEHLLVKPGDIAYNMMRMWQGAFGQVDKEGLVSPAYVVLKPKPTVDPTFASYLFKTKRMNYLFWAYSYGLTDDRLRLYAQDFSLIPVDVPKAEEQRKIAAILAKWDLAIALYGKLITNSNEIRAAIVQRTFSGHRRHKDFTSNWKKVRICDIAEVIVSNVDKKSSEGEQSVRLCNYTDVYHNSYIGNDLHLMTATASAKQIQRFSLKKGDVLITKDSEAANDIAVSACVSEDLKNVLCGYHLAIIRPNPEVIDSIFLSNLFGMHAARAYFEKHANGVTRFGLPLSVIENATIRIPELEEQRRISDLIFCVDTEIAFQSQRLALLKREKSALIQQLLTGKRRVQFDKSAQVAA